MKGAILWPEFEEIVRFARRGDVEAETVIQAAAQVMGERSGDRVEVLADRAQQVVGTAARLRDLWRHAHRPRRLRAAGRSM